MAVTPGTIITGRRKEAVARVRLVPGTGEFDINGRNLDDYWEICWISNGTAFWAWCGCVGPE